MYSSDVVKVGVDQERPHIGASARKEHSTTSPFHVNITAAYKSKAMSCSNTAYKPTDIEGGIEILNMIANSAYHAPETIVCHFHSNAISSSRLFRTANHPEIDVL